MSKVNQGALKTWQNGEVINAEQYNQERNIVVTAYNDTDARVDRLGAAGAIATTNIADSAVTTPKIANSSVTVDKLGDLSVTTAKIADGAVGTGKLMEGAVSTSKIADASVTTAKIADANVDTAKLADGSVTAPKLAANSVGAGNIIDGTVATVKVADGAITNPKLAVNAVATTNIVDGAIGSGKLANNAVQTDKLVNNAIVTAKIADANVTSAKIADGAVGTSKLANGAVASSKIMDGAVTETKITLGAVNQFSYTKDQTDELIESAFTGDLPQTAIDQILGNVAPAIQAHENKLAMHVSALDRTTWDAKANAQTVQTALDAANAGATTKANQAEANAKAASIPRNIPDERGSGTLPTDYSSSVRYRFKANGDVGLPASVGSYVVVCGMKGWHDDSGGLTTEIAYGNDGLYRRTGSSDNTSWNPWTRVVDSTGGKIINTMEFDSPVPAVMVSPSPTGKTVVFHRSSEEGLKNRLYIGFENNPKQGDWNFAKGLIIGDDDVILANYNMAIGSEINNLKSSVSNGKARVAAAITAKGVPTAADASFVTMEGNIERIRPPAEYRRMASGSLTFNGANGERTFIAPTLPFVPRLFAVRFVVNFGGTVTTETAVFASFAPGGGGLGSTRGYISQRGKSAAPIELFYTQYGGVTSVSQVTPSSVNYVTSENPVFEAYGY